MGKRIFHAVFAGLFFGILTWLGDTSDYEADEELRDAVGDHERRLGRLEGGQDGKAAEEKP